MNNITKTIQESLAKIDEMVENYDRYEVNEFESHLLQSQIRLLEAVIESMNKRKAVIDPTDLWANMHSREIEIYNNAIEDQISSLNETLEELKTYDERK